MPSIASTQKSLAQFTPFTSQPLGPLPHHGPHKDPPPLAMWGLLLRPFAPPPATTVIIPTFNEAEHIASTVHLARRHARSRVQVIVADGNSTDKTARLARRAGARVLSVSGGRAAQLNAAAKRARGNIVLFLHADTQLPSAYDDEMRRVLAARVVVGAFPLGIDSDMLGIGIVRAVANWRASFLQRPYGDQGLFMQHRLFDEVGGYPPMPFLDDYEMVRRLARRGRIGLARKSVLTSARRWETLGVVRTTLINQAVVAGYHLGVPVDKLHDWYRRTFIKARRKQTMTRAQKPPS